MDEKKLLDKIKTSAGDVKTPEGLSPERMKEKLKGEKQRKIVNFPIFKVASVVAAMVLVTVLIYAVSNIIGSHNLGEVQMSQESTAMDSESAKSDGTIATAKNESELYKLLKARQKEQSGSREYSSGALDGAADMAGSPESAEESAVESNGDAASRDSASVIENAKEADSEAATEKETDFSDTNIQEAGVQEADIVKTDGSYIYVVKDGEELSIVSADGYKLKEVGSVTLPELDRQIKEVYLDGDSLYIIASGMSTKLVEGSEEKTYQLSSRVATTLYTYDISKRSEPKLVGEVEQDGSYMDSRMRDGIVYLFTEYKPIIADKSKDSKIIPSVNGEALSAEEIYLPKELDGTSYLVISSVDVEHPKEVKESVSIVSAADYFYVSKENIYAAVNTYRSYGEGYTTQLLKFGYQKGKITAVGASELSGYVNDSFSMNEHEDHLRIVLTDSDGTQDENSLYILDKSLNVTGRILNIAKGEHIKSARFFGDIGYFVTFRQVDPLFSVDLSDPENPEILGELKISGFSSYLHFYGEDSLIGLGYEADEYTGRTTGAKLSLFDTSDPGNVKEADKYVIEDINTVRSLSNYKSILVSESEQLIGFMLDTEYMVFSCDGGFKNLLTYDVSKGGKERITYDDVRGIYIGDTFYIVTDSGITAFDRTDDYKMSGSLEY